MNKGKRLARWAMCVAVLAGAGGLAGCSATFAVYSDSILADAPPGNGLLIRTAISGNDPNWQITVPAISNWRAEGGKAMGGTTAHSFILSPLANPATNVVVYSFGTNDAGQYWLNGGPNGPGYAEPKAEELSRVWMDKAVAQSARCIVWVLPNTRGLIDLFGGAPWTPNTETYLSQLNNYFRGLVPTGYRGTKFRVVDWGQMIRDHPKTSSDPWTMDNVHANPKGASQLGTAINAQIRDCA